MKNKRRFQLGLVYATLIILSIIWLFPIAWVILTSFRSEGTAYVNYFIPKTFTLNHYINLFTN
ncbi:TPA: sugar ABC transporter permease, partial [Streptococcus pyogenes]|nr:sugar ABC transporter permease [Streptococcus pyogenes]